MLAKTQNDPFKYTVTNLKKVLNAEDIEKEHQKIKRALKTVAAVSNLNDILPIILDYHWFSRLCSLLQKLKEVTDNFGQKSQMYQGQQELSDSPPKTLEAEREMVLKRLKNMELTSSTKKSRNIATPNIAVLVEEFVDQLQKFGQIKGNSKRIKLLIQELQEELDAEQGSFQPESSQNRVDLLLKYLNDGRLQEFCTCQHSQLKQGKVQYLSQLLCHLQKINKFMEALRASTNELFGLLEQQGCEDVQNLSQLSSLTESLTKKSNNPSQQKSLLTEMLRDSSQKSNLEIPENEYTSQIVLRPKIKEYSHQQVLAQLDKDFRLGNKSVKSHSRSHRVLRSEMYNRGQENEESGVPIRKREIKLKKTEMGCSQCEIF